MTTERVLALTLGMAVVAGACARGPDPGPDLAAACRAWAGGDTAAAVDAAEAAADKDGRWADLAATLRGDAPEPAIDDVVAACDGVTIDPDDAGGDTVIAVAGRRALVAAQFTAGEADCLVAAVVDRLGPQAVVGPAFGRPTDLARSEVVLDAVYDCVDPARRQVLAQS